MPEVCACSAVAAANHYHELLMIPVLWALFRLAQGAASAVMFTAAESWIAEQRALWEARFDRLEAVIEGQCGAPPASAQKVDQAIARDPVKPGRERQARIVRRPLGMNGNQRLLHQVLHVGFAPGKPAPEIAPQPLGT